MQTQQLTAKELWDEFRLTKQVSEGLWWLISEPDVPGWFLVRELEWRGQGLRSWPDDQDIWDCPEQ